ncbi:hypothetical protein EZV62_018360 [Acer yangbiense]|uniref:hAT-like transposase RNase-H fold domain-containing protein n=1 Tax=Acer yangbiense TaxID=1000413 RepID=A0A5C7HJ55_9ROSI|nr:hypothetical protein EZV62_018360 [Acer yangbiense]
MAVNMKQKFDKYWKGLDKTNNLLIIAVVLNPRYKFGYMKWRFDAFYGVTQSQSMLSSLKEVLVNLYEYYVTQYGSVSVRSNDDVSSFGSGLPENFHEKEKIEEMCNHSSSDSDPQEEYSTLSVEDYLPQPVEDHSPSSNDFDPQEENPQLSVEEFLPPPVEDDSPLLDNSNPQAKYSPMSVEEYSP